MIRTLLEPWGELRPQPASDWLGPIPLPDVVARFYEHIGPLGPTIYESVGPVGLTIDVGGNPVCIPPLRKLWDLQAGYRIHGITREAIPGWNPDWLVVAEQGGDPFILDCAHRTVLFAWHGAGAWSPRLLAPDLPTAFGAVATVGNSLAALGEEARDDDYNLKDASRRFVTEQLGNFLGSQAAAEKFLHAWGWYE